MKIFKSKLLDILKEYKVSVDSIYFLLTQRFLINSKSANLVKFHVKVVQNLNLLKNNLILQHTNSIINLRGNLGSVRLNINKWAQKRHTIYYNGI